jgi:two-component system, cell cycle sensor histidine kinase and response regulator CckA
MPDRFLNSQDKKFRLLFEEHPQPMWILDAGTQNFLEANTAACTLYGYSRDEFSHLQLTDLQEPHEAKRFLEELHSPARPAASPWRHLTKAGRLIDVEIATYPIKYQGRGSMLAVVMDITSRRQLEDQLRQAQKMEAIGMLTGGVAHDFNNLLTIITGYSQLILTKLGQDDPNRQSVEQIVKAAGRAGELTRQLLVFSRRRTLQPKVLDLNQLVGSLSTLLRRLIGEDIELRLSLGENAGRVHADPGQLEQVLMNLAANSRDAMPKGGILTISTTGVEIPRATNLTVGSRSIKPGPYVRLEVGDTGAGMDEATRVRVFEPFFTTKGAGAGTGLGLFTVAGIVKQIGGAVEVSSEPGNGTWFRIYLPRVDQAVAPQVEAVVSAPTRGAETILVVEDDDAVRALVQETLQSSGYRVLEASDPLEARLIADTFAGEIQLLITDVIMPKASGRQLARGLLRHRPNLKVLYMSGHTESAIHIRGVRSKEVAFLSKPFTPAQLTDKVREVLEGDSNNHTHHAGE